MFLKQEYPEMDDFEEKKFCSKEKFQYFKKILEKISQNIVVYSFVSEHSKHYFSF